MKSAGNIRDRLALLLASEMPIKIDLLRQAWELDGAKLPNVDQFVSGDLPDDVLNAGRGSAWVVVVNPRLLRTRRTGDISELGEPEYWSTYNCRVYIWAKGKDWDLAQRARDELCISARLSLLQYPTLTNEGGDTGYRVEEGTYTEDFAAPLRVTGQHTWAPGMLSVDITAEEYIDAGSTLPALGVAEEIVTDTYAVGPAQPFPEEE